MKDIQNYEGHYAVTEDGKVWSHKRNKFLSPTSITGGYQQVELWKNGKPKRLMVHRLVAMAYIPNLNGLPQVGHDDDNPKNNHVSNLYWTDQKENNNHGSHNAKVAKARSKPVFCVELERIFDSATVAAEELGLIREKISSCCCGDRRTHGGYRWQFV